MEINITVPETVTFKRAGNEMTVKPRDFPETILRHIADECFADKIVQTVGDAASAASMTHYETNKPKGGRAWKELASKERTNWTERHAVEIAETGAALMQARLERLQAGEWQTRRTGSPGMSTREEYTLEAVIAAMEAGGFKWEKGTRKPAKLERAGEWLEKQSEDVKEHYDKIAFERIEHEKAEAAKVAEVAAKINVADF